MLTSPWATGTSSLAVVSFGRRLWTPMIRLHGQWLLKSFFLSCKASTFPQSKLWPDTPFHTLNMLFQHCVVLWMYKLQHIPHLHIPGSIHLQDLLLASFGLNSERSWKCRVAQLQSSIYVSVHLWVSEVWKTHLQISLFQELSLILQLTPHVPRMW